MSRRDSATCPPSTGAGFSPSESEPLAPSLPMPISKLPTARRSGPISISPSKAKRPAPDMSKAGWVAPRAPNTEVTKSLITPVFTERWPWSLLSSARRAAAPLKSSSPLETLRLSRATWPLAVSAPKAMSSFSGTPFTVAVPSISNGPLNDRTVAPASTFSAA